jgi:hypothetical protein
MNHSHISESRFRDIIHLFVANLEATQIVKITKISRPTINAILLRIRNRIALMAEKESYFTVGEIEIDKSYFEMKAILELVE